MRSDRSSGIDSKEFHVAIIMDGNGRWAEQRGNPRYFGHRAGADAVRRIVESAPEFKVTILTLYAFSSDNWGRPPQEVALLMRLFRSYLRSEVEKCKKNKIKINFIGRRDRLDPVLVAEMQKAEAETRDGDIMLLRIAIDYSARDMILEAARHMKGNGSVTRDLFSDALAKIQHSLSGSPDVDLLIRTGGEQRLSDFLLWECAYAELYFTKVLWPEFDSEHLEGAVREFQRRERRFGCVPLKLAR